MDAVSIDVMATKENIKTLIEKKELTPREIQRALGLSSIQAIYKWTSPNNKSVPSLENLLLLAALLECNVEDIIKLVDLNKN